MDLKKDDADQLVKVHKDKICVYKKVGDKNEIDNIYHFDALVELEGSRNTKNEVSLMAEAIRDGKNVSILGFGMKNGTHST